MEASVHPEELLESLDELDDDAGELSDESAPELAPPSALALRFCKACLAAACVALLCSTEARKDARRSSCDCLLSVSSGFKACMCAQHLLSEPMFNSRFSGQLLR